MNQQNIAARNSAMVVQRWLADARRSGTKDTYSGKRSEPRFAWDAPVTVEIVEDGQVVDTFYANTRDIGSGSIGLRCRKPLQVNTELRITLDGTNETIRACVIRSERNLTVYEMGARILFHANSCCDHRKIA